MANWSTPTTFAHAWARSVSDHPDSIFLIFEGPDQIATSWTYAQFDVEVERVAAFLLANGTGPGRAVHLALTNSPTFIAVWIAAIRLGAWIVPGDPMGRAPEFAEQIQRTNPDVGFYGSSRADEYLSAAPSAMVAVPVDEADHTFSVFPDQHFCEWPAPSLLDRAAVMFTSGTTGRPKGVEITQANYAFAGKTMAEAAGLTANDRHIVVLPLFHANAQYYSFASAIWAGASVALMHTFSASGFLGQAARHRATCASLFAAPLRMILARGKKTHGVELRHCWFAQNIATDQFEMVSDWFGCVPRQLYGMTETIPAVLTDEAAAPRPDAMGYVTNGCDVAIHRPDGTPAEPDEIGEIVVAGTPGITIFAGYLGDAKTSAASFRDGWFLTGDRASSNTDGRFFFDGRRSDILKVAGENVSTIEVEAVLTSHPKVLEASVVGAPDPVRDEVPVAYVVAAEADDPPTASELIEWCQTRLGKAKRPREVTFMDELPRTSVGKIRKFVLKEEALAQ
ncbi:MAG: AMP-binding protein [Acidimicrobiales bacterium]|nr:AMP-binding protein [Acidimicrobiales bacterium]MDG2219438.1 AMP-binding protein [Acidimicrobiales bacterium]